MFPRAVHMDSFVSAPQAWATGATGPMGQVMAARVSPVAQTVNLELVVNPPMPNRATTNTQGVTQKGVLENFITIYADGADLYIVFSRDAAKVASPSPTAFGTITGSGTYQGVTGACWIVKNGESMRLVPRQGQDKYMGVAASATGAIRMYMSNPSTGGGM